MPASDEDEFNWSPDSMWLVAEEEADRVVLATIKCAEMTLRSIEARKQGLARDRRVAPPGDRVYPQEHYYITAARFFALASKQGSSHA